MLEEIISLEELEEYEGEVVCVGAGMVLSHIEQMFCCRNLLNKIRFIVDNNVKKWGTNIIYGGEAFRIMSVEEVLYKDLKNPLLLITCEYDDEILEQIKKDIRFSNWRWASYPKLNHFCRMEQKDFTLEKSEKSYIPQMIHYIWFGNKAIPLQQRKFIEGWKKLCPDYKIRFWSESNYNVKDNVYTKEAYESGDYAHVSDYARMDILYRYGGFYMDTDVELLKSLDVLRCHQAVFTYGEWPAINSGVLCGAVPQNELIKNIRDNPRSNIHYYDEYGKPDKRTNCYYESEALKRAGFKCDFTTQSINGIAVYSPVYFASEGRYFDSKDISEQTIAIHHCAGSWKEKRES